MKKIIVAGAGHGGLVAAFKLAENGFDVTVIEAKTREETGWDWDDCIWYPILEQAGITADDKKYVDDFYYYTYYSPSKSVGLTVDESDISTLRLIDRRYLLKVLFEKCENAGAKLIFGEKIISALSDGKRVTGIKTEKGDYYGDLVIDAAGLDSPVRKSLPQVSGVLKELPEDKMIWTYRAYFENCGDFDRENPLRAIYFFHNNRPGMDWAVTFENYTDILIGSFSPLSDEEISEALADFRADYPYIGEKLLRGGTVQKIPLGLSIPKFVWNGYAAAGDSASMIEPMSGSGMTKSILAGKILAETVTDITDAEYTEKNLWKYEYEYMIKSGNSSMNDCILRDYMATLKGSDIDWFFEHKLITEAELRYKGLKIKNPLDALRKLMAFIPESKLLPSLAQVGKKVSSAKTAVAAMPEEYDRFSYEYWRKIYANI